jgi:hypothetical protein
VAQVVRPEGLIPFECLPSPPASRSQSRFSVFSVPSVVHATSPPAPRMGGDRCFPPKERAPLMLLWCRGEMRRDDSRPASGSRSPRCDGYNNPCSLRLRIFPVGSVERPSRMMSRREQAPTLRTGRLRSRLGSAPRLRLGFGMSALAALRTGSDPPYPPFPRGRLARRLRSGFGMSALAALWTGSDPPYPPLSKGGG